MRIQERSCLLSALAVVLVVVNRLQAPAFGLVTPKQGHRVQLRAQDVEIGLREERSLSEEEQNSLGVQKWVSETFQKGEKFGMDYTETTSVFVKSGQVEVELDPGIMECFGGHKGADAESCETTVKEYGPGDLAVFSPGVGCEWRIKTGTVLLSHKEKGYKRLADVPTAQALQRVQAGEERKRDFVRSRGIRWWRKLIR
mmetsp:Transcript_53925/g.96546  ORF Transcript_53925/g.96546 Transcript_53925/m.96546 type:complete len:199 (-) Transcript_53925:250-846(-)